MGTPAVNGPGADPDLAQGLVRTLRHEVGDFLQTVYSTVAILQNRLPAPMTLERTVVANLRSRAETCKHLLDLLHDFVCPVTLTLLPMHPAELAAKLTAAAAARHPHLDIRAEAAESPEIRADPQRLQHIASCLLDNACQSAAKEVRFHTRPGPVAGEVEWLVCDDGPGVAPDQMAHLFDVFSTARRGTLGLGLGAVRKLVALHGGRAWAENPASGGLHVHVLLPHAPPVPARQPAE